jgi:hypothetical protein
MIPENGYFVHVLHHIQDLGQARDHKAVAHVRPEMERHLSILGAEADALGFGRPTCLAKPCGKLFWRGLIYLLFEAPPAAKNCFWARALSIRSGR